MPSPCLALPDGPVQHPGQFLAWQFRQTVGPSSRAEAIWSPEESLSHGDVEQRAAAWAAPLAALGAQGGGAPVCGIYAGNTCENLFLGIGLLLAGFPQAILPLHAPGEELHRLIGAYGLDLVLADRPLPDLLGLRRIAALPDGFSAWARDPCRNSLPASPGQEAADWEALLARPAHLTLTSGTTTGIPRVNRVSFLSVLASLQRSNWPTAGRTLGSLALQFGSGRLWAMRILLSGATLCLNPGGSLRDLARLAGRAEADVMGVGNPFLMRVLEEDLRADFPGNLLFLSGSDRVPAPLRRRFHEAFGPRLS
ncbi:MAG: AMP-binding protein, partial [Synechococcaceae cyanobacterium]|nr:AMP-binding protein [Synechococcaceae cyanobacterium]